MTTDMWRAFVDTQPPEVDKQELRELNRSLDSGFMNHNDFCREVARITGNKPEDIEKLLNSEPVKNYKLLELIARLKAKGLKIGLLSNVSNNWIRDTFLTPEEQKLFDNMTFSYEVRMAKPDTRIFETACSGLNSEPTEAILVDDVERYCMAAESIGMKSIWYEEFDGFQKQLSELIGGNVLGKI